MSPALASRFLSIVSPGRSLSTCALKIVFWFVHELFLLRFLSEEMSIFLYPVLAGRILNRFSKDIGHMDDLLPLIFQDFIQVMYQSCQSSPREEQSACFSRPSHRGWGWAFSLVMCPVILSKGYICERRVQLWLGGWANMRNTWGRSGYTVTSRLVWSSDTLGKWFSLCLPGVWCRFPYCEHIS